MWQQEKKDSAIVSLALLLSLATTPMAVPLFVPTPVLAQSATDADSFPLPTTVEDDTTVRIDGSVSLAAINQSLKQSFEQEFSGSNVQVAANGADVAISALLDETIDLAAIARGLTPAEQAQGLLQAPFHREDIAIIVSTENPFQGSLTDQEFADIFRGNITDWSEVGGSEGAIRFIDRPETSDTRNTFRIYPSFQGAEFATGSNATQIDTDNTAEIVQQLGNDGISYAMAHHVSQMPNVRVIPLNEILPDNPNYPYSQPLVYAYRENPSPNVASFLGFVLASPEQQAIEAARTSGAAAAMGKAPSPAIAQGDGQTAATPMLDTGTASAQQQPSENPFRSEEMPLWWLLLPTAVIVGLLVWVFRSRLWPTGAKNHTPDANPQSSAEDELETNNTSDSPSLDELLSESFGKDSALTAGTEAPIGSMVAEEKVNHQESLGSNDVSNFPELETFDDQQSPWDIEAPASVVNSPYPQLPDISKVISDESKVAENEEIKDSSQEPATQPQVEADLIEDMPSNATPDIAADMDTEASDSSEIEDAEDTTDLSDFDEIFLSASDENILDAVSSSEPTLPDITEDILNVVADAAEPTNYETVSDLPDETDIFADSATFVGTVMGASADNQGHPENTAENPLFHVNGERSIVLKPRNSQWAYATWYIDQTCQEALANNGVSELALRLYDVTDFDLNYQTPQCVQQYELGSEIELYLAIPQSNRDYIAEIGYINEGNRWVTIIRSQRVRVFATSVEDTREDPLFNLKGERSIVLQSRNAQWAYATWYIDQTCQQTLANNGISELALRLYDVTNLDLSYQSPEFVEHYQLDSEIELYIAIPQCNRDYIAEIGYVTDNRWITITRSQRVRVFAPLVADPREEPLFNLEGERSIVIQPRNAQWAYATWYMDQTCQEALANNGISELGLRLYDVTDLDLSYQSPEFVEHYQLDSEVELYLAIPQSDRDYIAEIGYINEGDIWVTITRSQRMRVFDTPPPDTTAEPVLNLDGEQSIVIQPRNAQWAYVSWSIGETGQQTLSNNGISELALRLYDVTNLDLSYQTPEFLREYEIQSGIENKYIAIPQSDRDYIAEIGYMTPGDIWVTIARSQRVRVFGIPLTDNSPKPEGTLVDLPQTNRESTILLTSRTPKWAYASWSISPTDKQILQNKSISQLYLRLYNVTDLDLSYQTPQMVQQYECDEIISDRYVAIPATDRDYIAEIGYLTAGNRWELLVRSQRIRVFSRPQADFWFVADTELIIHGSTEPGAAVNIAGKPIKLKSDGTFHLRIPFSDDSVNYVMTAIAANGEHNTTIGKQFSQKSSES